MSRIFAAFALAGALLLAAPAANAAVRDFGTFTVDVPDGWTAEKKDGGCTITKNDETACVWIRYFSNDGATARQYADVIAKKLTNPVMKTDSNGVVTVTGTLNGVKTVTAVSAGGGTAALMTISALSDADFPIMGQICDSVKDK